MTEMYGSYSDEDLNEWERMPQNIRVLTSSAFGAWLLRRDKRIKEQEPKADIDSFVDFLITENCEGCTECEPRLPGDKSFACCEEGRAKWLLEMAKKFKKSEGRYESNIHRM